MFTKTLLFVFAFVGIFTILFTGVTSNYYANQGAYSASAGASKTVANALDMANVTIYSNSGQGNMTYDWSSYHDHPDGKRHQVGLPDGQVLEIWWGSWVGVRVLQFRHTTENWWGLSYAPMQIYGKDGNPVVMQIAPITVNHDSICEDLYNTYGTFNVLSDNWDNDIEASVFSTKTPVASSYLLTFNDTKYSNISSAWENGEISYIISYELDYNATGLSVWGLLGSLLSFNAPALGLGSSVAGLAVNAMIAIPIYVVSAIAIFKVATAIIPLLSGVDD